MDRKNSAYYTCTSCQAVYDQPLGRVVEKMQAGGNMNYLFKTQTGPTVAERCLECDSVLHVSVKEERKLGVADNLD